MLQECFLNISFVCVVFPGCQECEGNCSLIQGVPNNIGNNGVKDTTSIPTGKLPLLVLLTGLEMIFVAQKLLFLLD